LQVASSVVTDKLTDILTAGDVQCTDADTFIAFDVEELSVERSRVPLDHTQTRPSVGDLCGTSRQTMAEKDQQQGKLERV